MKNKNIFLLLFGLVIAITLVMASQLSPANLQGKLIIKSPQGKPLTSEGRAIKFKIPLSPEAQSLDFPISRAELAKIIVVKSGADASGYASCAPDVEAGSWYEPYVCYMVAKNIMTPYPNGQFEPMGPVLRSEGAKVFAKSLFSIKVYSPKKWYADVPADAWFFDYVNALAIEKILDVPAVIDQNGTPMSFFQPGAFLTKKAALSWASKVK